MWGGIAIFQLSNNNTIQNNTIVKNLYNPEAVDFGGLLIYDSTKNVILQNNISQNSQYGLLLCFSDENNITENIFYENTQSNVYIMGDSSNNIIYLNDFYNSTSEVTSQVSYEEYTGSGNSWDYGFIGNYWYDYEHRYPGATNDGLIWDTPYVINAMYSERDNYPLVEPISEGTFVAMSMTTPDLDLHVYDSEGRHVGVNYTTLEAEIEIPGAFYSGDHSNGTEWIFLPANVTDYYVVVDARDAHYPVEEYTLSIFTWTPEGDLLQTSRMETIEAGETDTWVPQVDPETGELTIPSVEESITEKLELLIAAIMQLEDSVFDKNPSQRKNALRDKIIEVIDMVAFEDYSSADDKVLHDLKPKLTGLKTDEDEISWGNGVFKKPWVTDADAQEGLRKQCNAILYEINLII